MDSQKNAILPFNIFLRTTFHSLLPTRAVPRPAGVVRFASVSAGCSTTNDNLEVLTRKYSCGRQINKIIPCVKSMMNSVNKFATQSRRVHPCIPLDPPLNGFSSLAECRLDAPRCEQLVVMLVDSRPRPRAGSRAASKNSPQRNVRCYNCGDVGHVLRNCRHAQSGGNVHGGDGDNRCASPGGGAYVTDQHSPVIVCYKCGQEGHLARRCPVVAVRCFKCNEIGHISLYCPNILWGHFTFL